MTDSSLSTNEEEILMTSSKRMIKPKISPEAHVDRTANVVGDVTIEAECYVAPKVSIRADEGTPFYIGSGTNIQDGVILHGLKDQTVEVDGRRYSIYIGSHCSITHGALVHGPSRIGDDTFLGFRSTVHKSTIGRGCHIGFHALVKSVTLPDDTYVPDGSIINSQDKVAGLPKVVEHQQEFNQEVVEFNKTLVDSYKKEGLQNETTDHHPQ